MRKVRSCHCEMVSREDFMNARLDTDLDNVDSDDVKQLTLALKLTLLLGDGARPFIIDISSLLPGPT